MNKKVYYYAVYSYTIDGVTMKENTTLSSDEGFPLAALVLHVAKEVGISPTAITVDWFTPIPKKVFNDFRKLITMYNQ